MKLFTRLALLPGKARAWLCVIYFFEATAAAAAVVLLCIYWPAADGTGCTVLCAALALWLAMLCCCGWMALYIFESDTRKKLDAKSSEEMKSFQLKQRTLRHDINIHFMALLGMLEAKKYGECHEYLQRMLHDSKLVAQLMPLDDPAISAMLHQLTVEANAKQVEVECAVFDDFSRIDCDAYEVNQILGNLVRNAVEASLSLPTAGRNVQVTLLSRRDQCIMRIENTLAPGAAADERMFEYGYSSKPGHSGIGLAAVKKLVKLHRGVIFYELEDDRLRMIVQLPFKKAAARQG